MRFRAALDCSFRAWGFCCAFAIQSIIFPGLSRGTLDEWFLPKFSDTDISPEGGTGTRKDVQHRAIYHSERSNSLLDGQYCSQDGRRVGFVGNRRQLAGNRTEF